MSDFDENNTSKIDYQSEERKTERLRRRILRIERKQNYFNVLFYAGIPLIIAIVTIATTLSYYPISEISPQVFAICFGIIITIYSVFAISHASSTAKKFFAQFDVRHLHAINEFKAEMDKSLEPALFILEKREEIQARLIRAFDKLVKDKGTINKYVTYLGAASLTPTQDEMNIDYGKKYGSQQSPALIYKSHFEKIIKSSDIETHRYVCLFTKEQFQAREKQQTDYIEWVKNQMELIVFSGGQYVLYDAKKAPIFGSAKSTIILNNGVFDIFGKGNSGYYVRSSNLAKSTTNSLVRAYINGFEDDIPVTRSAAQLKNHLKQLGVNLSEWSINEEEVDSDSTKEKINKKSDKKIQKKQSATSKKSSGKNRRAQ